MTTSELTRARAGDEQAFRDLTDPYRRELQLHCYRILGSVQDAEDALQETLLAAWRGLDGFEGRSSLRSWLYTIATNRSLNALRDGARRPQERRALSFEPPDADPPQRAAVARAIPGRAARGRARRRPRPGRPLRGARDGGARVRDRAPAPPAPSAGRARPARRPRLPGGRGRIDARHDRGVGEQRAPTRAGDPRCSRAGQSRSRAATAVARRARARGAVRGRVCQSGSVDQMFALLDRRRLGDDAARAVRVPGPRRDREFFTRAFRARGERNDRLVATRANGQPAFGHYLGDPQAPIVRGVGVIVLTLEGDRISRLTRFGGSAHLARFGLPRTLPL